MNTKPLVSVITCTHNRPLFVRKAIELFMAQTWPNKEMILMDDGPEGTVPDVSGLPIRHIRIPSYTWVTQKHRMAFDLCRGEFVGYWDDDDWYRPSRLAVQAEHLIGGQSDAVGFHVKLIVAAPDGGFWVWKRSTLDKWERAAKPGFDAGLPFHDGAAVWRRDLLKGIPEATLQGTQLDLLRTLRARGARLAELPNDGAFIYVRHSHVGWDFDVRDLCEPVDCPEWVPREMVAFWLNPALRREGVRNA